MFYKIKLNGLIFWYKYNKKAIILINQGLTCAWTTGITVEDMGEGGTSVSLLLSRPYVRWSEPHHMQSYTPMKEKIKNINSILKNLETST
jgi:hypothetical protein